MSENIPLSQRAIAAARPRAPEHAASYLDGLNPPQRQAVLETDGPVLVLAGAGTGKTKALTTRLAHVISTNLAMPWQILAVTFTNKAAREMKERVESLVGDNVEGMQWLGTFHSVAAKILRIHAELVGLKPSFTIIDTDDQTRLCKQAIEAANLDPKRWTPRGLAAFIDDWKNRGLTPSQVPAQEAHFFANGKGIDLYKFYQERLITLNAADFGDLLLHNITIFQKHLDVLEKYQNKFRYMLVDEYQDTNIAQYLWLRLLAQKHKNICCVGDDDQSIYGWRGAEVANILKFEKDFPGAKIIRLEQNYRSTPAILATASALISANTSRLGKTLWTESTDEEKVQLRGVWDGEEEARAITDEMEAEQAKGRSLSDMAVLVRASFQMRAFEERFNMAGISYQVVGGPRFYEREETRDALAYLRLVRNPEDDLSFARIINKPRRGLGEKAMQTLEILARSQSVSLFQAARIALETDELKGKAKTGVGNFLITLERWREFKKDFDTATLTETILDESGYTDYWKNNKAPNAASKLDNLKELVNAAGEFDTLEGYLDHVSLVSEINNNETEGQVMLMTLHAAKGLEWPIVFLAGWEEDIFPSARSLEESGNEGLEEERRLAYVGITRARESCRIYFAANRQIYGRWQNSMPSRFIDELPEEHVEVASEAGVYGNTASKQSQSIYDLPEDTYKAPSRTFTATKSYNRSSNTVIEGKAKRVPKKAKPKHDFKVGERLFHQKFGYGTVESIDGDKCQISFEKAGDKKVVASFLERP